MEVITIMICTSLLPRFIFPIVLLIVMSAFSLAQAAIIDVTKYGAVGDNDVKKALQNTEAIKKAWNQAAREDGTGGTLYFPAGTYVVNRIGAIKDGFAALKYTNIKGDGQVKSILKLAPGQNSQLLRLPDRFFIATISDIGFFGNGDRNPDTDYLVHIAGYSYQIKNIYIAHSGGSGLQISGGQQIRVEEVEIEHNKKWGIVSENAMSITFDSLASEHNGSGGLLIQAEANKNVRAVAPAVIVSGSYFENEPIGLELRGVSGVEVHAVSAHSVSKAVKISNDPTTGLASTGNIIYAQGGTGDMEISKGNYGNTIIVGPYTKNALKIVDADGRNYIGPLGKTFSEAAASESAGRSSLSKKREMADWKASSSDKASWKIERSQGSETARAQSCKDITSYQELISSGLEGGSISYTMDAALEQQTDHIVEAALDIYGSCRVELEVYDTRQKQYYNWGKESWSGAEKLAAVVNTTRMPVLTNGSFQLHQFTIKTDNKPRQPRLTFFVDGCFGRKARFYCTDVRK